MKFIKSTAMALVAGAGLALVASQALAQSSSTNTTSLSGNTEDVEISAGISSTQIDSTHTSGGAIAGALATPLFTTSGGASFPGFSGTGPETASPEETGGGLYGATLSGGSFHVDNGHSDTFALNHVALWINASAASTQGSTTTSSTTSGGVSVAGLFVFGQTIAVPTFGSLHDSDPIGPEVILDTGVLVGDSGYVALNQVAGVGNQQGNNLSTLTEVTGANETSAGANSVNVEGNQTLADAGSIDDSYTTIELSTIAAGDLTGDTGAIAVNQAAGVANQQVNNITLAH